MPRPRPPGTVVVVVGRGTVVDVVVLLVGRSVDVVVGARVDDVVG